MTKLKKLILSLVIFGAIGLTVAQLNVSIRDLMGTSLPGTCAVGQRYFKTDATAGRNLYGCTSTNTWTVLGDGTGSSGLTLIETKTASASSSLDFTSCLSSTYDNYEIIFTDIVTSVNGENVGIRVSTDGGSNYISTGSYLYSTLYWNNTGSALLQNATSTNVRLFQSTSTAAFSHLNVVIHLFNPLASAGYKSWKFEGTTTTDSGTVAAAMTGFGHYKAETAINAFRVYPESGTLTSGTVRCYGIAK